MMTHAQYRAALDRLGLTQAGAARLFGINERTSRYYAAQDEDRWPVPTLVELALGLMIENAALKKKLDGKAGQKAAAGARR